MTCAAECRSVSSGIGPSSGAAALSPASFLLIAYSYLGFQDVGFTARHSRARGNPSPLYPWERAGVRATGGTMPATRGPPTYADTNENVTDA